MNSTFLKSLSLLAFLVAGSTAMADEDKIEIVGYARDGSLVFYTAGTGAAGAAHGEIFFCGAKNAAEGLKPAKEIAIEKDGTADAALAKIKEETQGLLKSKKVGSQKMTEVFTAPTTEGVSSTDLQFPRKKASIVLNNGADGTDVTLKAKKAASIGKVSGGEGYKLYAVRAPARGKHASFVLSFDSKGADGASTRKFTCLSGNP